MHVCYLDESGLDERSRSLVIAGYFAHALQWARFEPGRSPEVVQSGFLGDESVVLSVPWSRVA